MAAKVAGAKAKGKAGKPGLKAGEKGLKSKFPSPQLPIATTLLRWYDRHRRVLPWRALKGETADPYRVWLSEIMLQQTTIAAVIPYFHKFIARWPTVRELAAASLDDVFRLWAGLGYYRRARGLHDCAQRIVAEYDGVFPADQQKLLALPGFGLYTAAAVASIAFGQRANVVDGNVERVIARIFAVQTPLPGAKTTLRELAATLLPNSCYGDYAQALMDLGATICTPRNPKCLLCPWQAGCQANARGIQNELPRRVAKAVRPIRRAIAFALFNPQGELWLRPRPSTGLLGGMLEVPSSAWLPQAPPNLAAVAAEAPARNVSWRLLPGGIRHVFTHFALEIAVAVGTLTIGTKPPAVGSWVAPAGFKAEALPSVMHKIAAHALAGYREGA